MLIDVQQMGACSSDRYKQIREEYGLDLTKLVIAEKNKLFLDRLVSKLKKEISDHAQKTEANALALITTIHHQIEECYQRVRAELDERQPGGIKSLEQMSTKSAEDLLGYTFVRGLLEEFSQNVRTRLKEEEHELIRELVEVKELQEHSFTEEKPTMEVFDEMPGEEKEAVLKRGEMEFHDLVVKYEEYILARYGHRLEQEYYLQRFNSIDPRESLEALLFLARDKFTTSLNLILSQKITSYILLSEP